MSSPRHRNGRRGRRPAPRVPKDVNEILERREARRSARLAAVVASLPPDELTHESVAELAGVPLGYLRWRYPGVGDLAAVTPATGNEPR